MNRNVSVMVLTFNSASTIVETLESILNQTIGPDNIELIISDDASNDNTSKIIKSWLSVNHSRFMDTHFLEHSENQGVSKNCNSGWNKCSNEWIKTIGGDDLLDPHCLEYNLDYTKENPDCNIVFSKMIWFGRINKTTPEPFNKDFFTLSALEQHRYLQFKSFNIAPTSFMRRLTLTEIGYADERFRTIEDLPLWLRFTKHGHRLHYFPEVTVRYRISDSASKHSKRYVNELFLNDLIKIYADYPLRNMSNLSLKFLKIDMSTLLYGKKLISKLTKNKVGLLSKFLDCILLILRPFYIIRKIKRHFVNYFYRNC